ncbi:RelA/SpoT family protein [Azospirillum sp.]|uniref:RelA/SpoT family protein n=1 Tax=Azospirillum sp. TaxID=34012 RepID=UPI003D753FC7
MIRQYELVERVRAYDPSADEDLLNRAYVFSMKAHGSQTRASGDPYFSHPLEVAGILTNLKLDTATIVTALLHDTVEDTVATQDDIERLFGREIGRLVDGVTKLSRLEMQSEQAKQAENFRKLVLAMSEDIRVLLVKLADRLHNMRTLHHIKNPDKRKRIARETLEIYAPLAERIGMHQVKDELEDLAFAQLNAEGRDSILAQLSRLRSEGEDRVQRIIDELGKVLRDDGVEDAQISGREKTPYSIWRKLQQKNVSFEQLSDIMAFRIIVGNVGECYQALGIIHSRYPVVPGRFKDYISTPKPNGYKSLHTGVIGPQRNRIEVQIRTKDMHEVCELGVAAHWAYKQGQPRAGAREYRWLRELLDILEHATKPEEFLEHTKLELFQDQVFCFTPKGDLIALPRGATPVDFAYAVHSEVGDHCVGAKINGRMLPLRTQLQNGDQVDIITSKAQTPVPGWERFVVTGKARARIRKFLRTQQRSQYIELGRAILQRQFRQEGYDYGEKALEGVLKIFQQPSVDDLLAAVGSGLHSGREVFHAVFPGHKPHALAQQTVQLKDGDDKAAALIAKPKPKPKGREAPLPIRGLIPGMAVHYARCCHPLPGDRIVGIVTTGKGVTIHTIDCETLESFNDSPERWIDVAWDVGPDSPEEHVGRIHLVVANEPGSLGSLSTVIGKNGGNITNLKITNRNTDFFELIIDIDVKDAKHLTNIMAALRATPVINAVDRARGR